MSSYRNTASDLKLPALYTEAQAAEALGVNPRTLRNARCRGDIAWVKIGRCVRYTLKDLEAFIDFARVANDTAPKPKSRSKASGTRSATVVPFTSRRRGG